MQCRGLWGVDMVRPSDYKFLKLLSPPPMPTGLSAMFLA